MSATTDQKNAAQLPADLDEIISLIQSAHYASAFQSIGQYRTALNEFNEKVTKS